MEKRNLQNTGTRACDPAFERLHLGVCLLAPAACFGVAFIATFLFSFVLALIQPALLKVEWISYVVSCISLYGVGVPMGMLLLRLSRGAAPPAQKLSVPGLLSILPVCFLFAYGGNFVGTLLNTLLYNLTGVSLAADTTTRAMQTPFWANLLFVGILAPIMEELFFRKMMIDRLRRYGDISAIVISSLIFGAIHGNLQQLLYAAFVGALFGCVYLYLGDVRYTIALHMVINLLSGVFLSEFYKYIDPVQLWKNPQEAMAQSHSAVALFLYTLLIWGLVLAGVILFIRMLLRPKRRPERGEVPLTRRDWIRVGIANPATWVLLACLLLLFF